ncbi:MAG: hypothetical protein OEV60_10725 [Actinomycetota bacterium]|nr:hypothetical protein [Actinomycetota bacterium]MDH5225675.1 hypothetical protein [Actinomycetota bacterium]MDH5314474.1 hypothetical protein [Actinomycetota bacterium]
MKIVATDDVVEHVRARGGQVFVWPVDMVYGFGFERVFTLEASTDSPGAEREFVTFRGEAFVVHYDPGDRGTPEEIHLRLTGRRRPALRAYWDGHSFSQRPNA